MSMQLIKSFDMKLATPDCFPGADWYRVIVAMPDDITDLLPYLNAELEDTDYNHNAKILLWNKGDKKYAFRPHEIVIAPIENSEEDYAIALPQNSSLTERVNFGILKILASPEWKAIRSQYNVLQEDNHV